MAFKRWADGIDTESFVDMAERGAQLEEELQRAAQKRIAFADKGDEQDAFCYAADYADEWAENFRAWYICQANQGAGWGTCNTLIESKAWDTLHEDPMATKQRWYCGVCGTSTRRNSASSLRSNIRAWVATSSPISPAAHG